MAKTFETIDTKGMTWSEEARQKALQQHKYIKLGGKGAHLLLSGALARWKKPEGVADIYIPSLRVAGNPAVIRQVLLKLGSPPQEVEAHIQNSYNSQNINDPAVRARFDAEVDALKQYKKAVDTQKKYTAGPAVTLDRLDYYLEHLDQTRVTARAPAAGSPAAAPAGSPRGRVQPLLKRLQAAKAKGKVLDVTKMDPVKGTNVKMITLAPGTRKLGVNLAQLPLVSNNRENYVRAVQMLGPEYQGFVAQYDALNQKTLPPAGLAPARSPTRSPPRAFPTSPAQQFPAFPATAGLAAGTALPQIPGTYRPMSPIGTPK